MSDKITVLLADDHALVRAGIRALIERTEDIVVVGEARDGSEAVRLSRELRPNVVVMDISMPELNGFEATRQIVDELPGVRVLAVTVHSAIEYASSMFRAGASGFLSKTEGSRKLTSAIRSVNEGTVFLSPGTERLLMDVSPSMDILTPRQREILQLIAEGNSSREIAQKLSISLKTFESHRTQIFERLGLNSIAELVRYAIREGITSL